VKDWLIDFNKIGEKLLLVVLVDRRCRLAVADNGDKVIGVP